MNLHHLQSGTLHLVWFSSFTCEIQVLHHSVEEVEKVLETLGEVELILEESTTSDIDISRKLSIVSQTISRLNETQLHQIWERVLLPENATVVR